MVARLLTDESTAIIPERKEMNREKWKDLSSAEGLRKKKSARPIAMGL